VLAIAVADANFLFSRARLDDDDDDDVVVAEDALVLAFFGVVKFAACFASPG